MCRRPRVRATPASLHCVRTSSLLLVQLSKIRPYITERLLMGRKESNLTNKQANTSRKCTAYEGK